MQGYFGWDISWGYIHGSKYRLILIYSYRIRYSIWYYPYSIVDMGADIVDMGDIAEIGDDT